MTFDMPPDEKPDQVEYQEWQIQSLQAQLATEQKVNKALLEGLEKASKLISEKPMTRLGVNLSGPVHFALAWAEKIREV